MSTLKSSAEHLTLNADGSGNDIKFQSNATEVAAIDQSGNLTLSGTVDGVDIQTLNTAVAANTAKVTNSTSASDLTSGTLPDARFPSALPAISGAALTGIDAATVSATAPSSPAEGDMWFNSSASTVSGVASKCMSSYSGTTWNQMSNKFSASGGTESTYSSGGNNYKAHTFTSSGTFTSDAIGVVDVLIVAGGGGYAGDGGGGGGAGGMIVSTSLSVTASGYSITIGNGGASCNTNDCASASGSNTTGFSLTAIGGGGGTRVTPSSGGSGMGEGRSASSPGAGTTGQGNAGGTGGSQGNNTSGGGGGAGGVGGNAAGTTSGSGGAGLQNSFRTGSNEWYSTGGRGGVHASGTIGSNVTGYGGYGSGGGSGTTVADNDGGDAGVAGIVVVRYVT